MILSYSFESPTFWVEPIPNRQGYLFCRCDASKQPRLHRGANVAHVVKSVYDGTNHLNDDNSPGSYQSTVAIFCAEHVGRVTWTPKSLFIKGNFIGDRNRSSYRHIYLFFSRLFGPLFSPQSYRQLHAGGIRLQSRPSRCARDHAI